MTSPQPTTERSLVGAVLAKRLRLVQRLGEGGMGEVYAAEPVAGGQRVAVKILHREFLGEPSVLLRFLDEAKTSARLIHPNIVRVHECAEAEDGSPFLVMELLEGVPLSAYTQNGGRVPMSQAAPILQGILAGLAAAHAQQIIHRDLKPENVFLTREASGHFIVKVLDFGIAKVMDAAGGMGNKTRTGMLLGTPAYMSPEQIKSAKDVDARADLWSAGVMFYEMLTGKVAFPAPTEYARLSAVLTATPEAIEKIDPQLAPFAPFVQKAMQKDKNGRFQSALEMARALTAASGIEPSAASRVSVEPLSRLPDVPSLFAPSAPYYSQGAPTAPAQNANNPVLETTQPDRGAMKTPSGTLASPTQGQHIPSSHPPPPQVLLVNPPVGGTLPSHDLPMLQPVKSGAPRIGGGVAPAIVVALVAAALFAGFLIGFAVARLM